MRLETDRCTIDNVTAEQLRQELEQLDGTGNTRAILSKGDEIYMQTAWFDNGFVVEKREGSEARHFHAVPQRAPLPSNVTPPKRNWFQRLSLPSNFQTSECAFSKEDMIAFFLAYREGNEAKLSFEWKAGFCDR